MRSPFTKRLLPFAFFFAMAIALAPALSAQVVTSEIRGTVTDQDGRPLSGAQVSVTDLRTNITTGSLSGNNGRYFVSQLQPGGPYTVTAQLIGYRTTSQADVQVTLSAAETVNFVLQETAVQVEELTVSVESNPVFSQSKTGVSTTVGTNEIESFPTINRQLLDIALLSPYANTFEDAPSIAGKANRLNNIQIDGAVNNDVFGVGETGTPGGQGNAKPITLEAIEEFQVLVAPFDVRQSNFSGGLINAVTKAGTNQWEFSGFGLFTNESFVSDLDGDEFGEFSDTQLGGTLGGPLVREKLFFFGAFEFQAFDNPRLGFEPGVGNDFSDGLGIDPQDAVDIQDIFRNVYGVDPGTTAAFQVENPRTNIFGRLDWQIAERHKLVLRHNYSRARNSLSCNRGGFGEYCYTSNISPFVSNTNSTVGQLFSRFGDRWENELLLNLSFINDERDPSVAFGQVTTEASFDFLVGAERFSQANSLDQTIFQLTNNLTGRFGDHRVTFGTSNEFYSFENLFEPGLLGLWTYASIDDLENNVPDEYVKRVPASGVSPEDLPAKFNATQLAFYVQDQWAASDNLTFTAGLRAEIPIFPDSPRENSAFNSEFGVDNTNIPSNPLWQPRLGINYTMPGEYLTQLRGGIGLFAGRSPFVWISNAYGNTGIQSVDLVCESGNAPLFDPSAPAPTTCLDGSGADESGLPVINTVDESFKFPLDLKISAGIDRELPGGFSGTVEVLYSKAMEEVFFEEVNLGPITGTDPIEGRPYFGTPTASGCGSRGGCFTGNTLSDDYRNVVNLTNRSESSALLLTLGLQKQFSDWLRLRSSYTWADVQDIQVQQSSQATSNFGRNPINGDPNNPEKTDSNYEVENKIVIGATGQWDFADGWYFQVTPTYLGQSGLPYSYVVRGDPNGDNYRNRVISRDNDLIYIPNDVSELAFTDPDEAAAFDALINSDECLTSQRGGLMTRNSCRNPWNSTFDINFTVGIPIPGAGNRVVELVGIVQNLFATEYRLSRVDRGIEVLRVTGREGGADNGRFVYDYRGPQADSEGRIDPFSTLSPQSNRRFQLGARVRF
ncbi:MAG: carboxypeptidase regulatory-like domain-containing protein [Gemmatimonadota bacterium]|nr:carboxypeptidase regulatory-like domain-containing protein [Gemmatimonadota bacterium]